MLTISTSVFLALAQSTAPLHAARLELMSNSIGIKLTSLQPSLTLAVNDFVQTLSTGIITFTVTGKCSKVRVGLTEALRVGTTGNCTISVSQKASTTYAAARASMTLPIRDTATARQATIAAVPNPDATVLSQSSGSFTAQNKSMRSWIINSKQQDISWLVDYLRDAGWTVLRVLQKNSTPNEAWFVRNGVDAHVEQHIRFVSGKQATHVLLTIGDQCPKKCPFRT